MDTPSGPDADDMAEEIQALFAKDPESENLNDLETSAILPTLDDRPVSRLIPDHVVAPSLMAFFRKYLEPLLVDVPAARIRNLEDHFVVCMGIVYANPSHGDAAYFMDRCELVAYLVGYLQDDEMFPRDDSQPDMDTCVAMLGDAENYATHILPYASTDASRALLEEYFSPKRRKH